MSKYLSLFVSEAGEHIQAAEVEISRLAAGLAPPETIHSLFRHFHSIKGMAASMGFAPIASLSHAVEDLFDALRKQQARPSPDLAELVQEVLDATAEMVNDSSRPGAGPVEGARVGDLVARVRARLPAAAAPAAAPAPAPGREPAPSPSAHRFRCIIEIDSRADFPGARALMVLRRLKEIGTLIELEPAEEVLSRADFRGTVSAALHTDRAEPEVHASLKGLLDVARFEVTPEAAGAAAPVEEDAAATVRIPTRTLDDLLESLSEIITRRGALSEAIRAKDLVSSKDSLSRLSESIQLLRARIMRVRLMPFGHIVPRLERTLRDLCRRTGKKVSLLVTGADVSLDRSVLEEIADPLSHILRNAVDHGIELPSDRSLIGKPPEGTVRLDVSREGDHVLVVMADDGRGMDRDAIVRTALAGGFVTESDLAAMDEERIMMLTTIPGFSTASQVTEVSGRGVGMDVVRTRIEALHGHVRIGSDRGAGTRIELRMPISVAVIEAFLVEADAGVFAVPADSVAGVHLVDPARVRTTVTGRFLAPQEEGSEDPSRFVPLISLDEALGAAPNGSRPGPEASDGAEHGLPFPVLSFDLHGIRAALAVQRIRERRELVVKPLGTPLERLHKYSGAALLDDGGVALILDLAALGRRG